jgi:hypothetical protein
MTVIARRIVASPVRTASEAWQVIVELVAPNQGSDARSELRAVDGIASSLIAAEAMKTSPIVVWGVGPRLRMYCLYDEDAVIGEEANEKALPTDVTAGDWSMSLPCPSEDLSWVQEALAKRSRRVTARDMESELEAETINDAKRSATIDEEVFFRS